MSFPRRPLIAAACLLTLAATAAPVKKQNFDACPMVAARNIFDPERQPGVASSAAAASVSAAPVSGSDCAALTGTMLTAQKTLAFFSGSRPEWGGVFAVGASIGGARITKITSAGIEVERDGKKIAVAVGQSVPLDANSAPAAASALAPSASQPPSVSPSAPTVPASSDREAIIRRMMEKRQQELK